MIYITFGVLCSTLKSGSNTYKTYINCISTSTIYTYIYIYLSTYLSICLLKLVLYNYMCHAHQVCNHVHSIFNHNMKVPHVLCRLCRTDCPTNKRKDIQAWSLQGSSRSVSHAQSWIASTLHVHAPHWWHLLHDPTIHNCNNDYRV